MKRWAIREASVGANSQDRVIVSPRPEGLLVVLADGAGGLAGGTLAASMIVEELQDCGEQHLAGALASTDLALARHPKAGESTGVVVACTREGISGASAGDSEAWLINADGIEDLTAGQHRGRLGSGRADVREFRAGQVAAGTRLLVASDGLFKYASSQVLEATARLPDLEEAASALLDAVRLSSGSYQDDVALVLVES